MLDAEHSEGHLTASTAAPRGEQTAHRPAPTYSFSVAGRHHGDHAARDEDERQMFPDGLSSTGRVRKQNTQEARYDDINGPV